MIQNQYYAFDSPNDSKFRYKSLNFRTLGWTVTPVQQLTASKENSNCYDAVSDNNTKCEDRTGYAKLLRKVNKIPTRFLTSKNSVFPLYLQQNVLNYLLTISNLSC